MEKIRKIVLALSFFALLAPSAFPWDDMGHKLSVMIAWEVMTPAARERAIKILLSAPEDSHLSVQYSGFSARSESVRQLELFMFASTWPDVVRNRDFENRYRKYHKSNWHYGDIFWEGDGKIMKDFPEPSGVAIAKLAEFEASLGSTQVSDGEKAIALAWFLHVAGDIHNPLHNASRVTPTEPKGDQGGNLFYLEPAKTDGSWRFNLHSFWDGQITRSIPRENDACDVDYLKPIAKMSFAMYGNDHFKNRLKLSDYADWNSEGFAFLAPKVYKGLARDSMPDEAYSNRAFALAFEQISLAGHRIGNTLNAVLDPQHQH